MLNRLGYPGVSTRIPLRPDSNIIFLLKNLPVVVSRYNCCKINIPCHGPQACTFCSCYYHASPSTLPLLPSVPGTLQVCPHISTYWSLSPNQGFSTSAWLTFWAGCLTVSGASLCTAGWLVASLALTPPVWQPNCVQALRNVSGGRGGKTTLVQKQWLRPFCPQIFYDCLCSTVGTWLFQLPLFTRAISSQS